MITLHQLEPSILFAAVFVALGVKVMSPIGIIIFAFLFELFGNKPVLLDVHLTKLKLYPVSVCINALIFIACPNLNVACFVPGTAWLCRPVPCRVCT